MSSPAPPETPANGSFLERGRHWWSPIARAIDRWLEPRWRALLTWTVLSVATSLAVQAYPDEWMWNATLGLEKFTPFALPYWWRQWAVEVPFVVLFCWFKPVVLRLGFTRVLVWAGVALACTFVFILGNNAQLWRRDYNSASVFSAVSLGLCGLAIAGRRSRPWMSLLAAACRWAFQVAMDSLAGLPVSFESESPDPWSGILTTVIGILCTALYGAIMLYGTAPIPPKPRDPPL